MKKRNIEEKGGKGEGAELKENNWASSEEP